MNKKFKALALAMSMALVAPSFAMAAESKLDADIKKLDEKISSLEKTYKEISAVNKKLDKSAKSYKDKDGNIKYDTKAAQENLIKVATQLDKYVDNTVPSIEQAMLSGYFQSGAKIDGYTIRPQNTDDLYNYLKNYFVLKNGLSKSAYDKLLRKYVNAISDATVIPSLQSSIEVIEDDVKEQKAKIDKLKEERKALVKKKTERDNLEKAVSKAKITLEACKQLISLSPNKISDVREEVDSLMAEQETLIKAAEKVLSQYK